MSDSRTKNHRTSLLDVLLRTRGWVSAYELARVGGLQFQTRVWELRHKFGLTMENETKRGHDGTVHSSYRLLKGFQPGRDITIGPSASSDEAAQPPLFETSTEHLDLG
jgi:hypothetical protein